MIDNGIVISEEEAKKIVKGIRILNTKEGTAFYTKLQELDLFDIYNSLYNILRWREEEKE